MSSHIPTPTAFRRVLDLHKRAREQRLSPDRALVGRFSMSLLESSLDSAIELTLAERGFIVVPRAEAGFEILTGRDPKQSNVAMADKFASYALFMEAAREKRTLVIEDPHRDPRFKDSQSAGALQLRSIILVPLLAHGTVHGALVLHEKNRAERFATMDSKLAELVAEPATNALETLLEDHAVEGRVAALRKSAPSAYQRFVGQGRAMTGFYATLKAVCDSDARVVIYGETGTGKEITARTIVEKGRRAKKPLVAVNAASFPENLIEAELFGYTKGAFSGAVKESKGLIAQADGGTLFIDEVGDLSLQVQAKLLRFLEVGEVQPLGGGAPRRVDVRVISATHKNLDDLVAEGKFRQDLVFRLEVLKVRTVPLRAHMEDLPDLCEHFLEAAAKAEDKPVPKLSPELWQALQAHSFPGNVRELAHLMYRAVALSTGVPVTPELIELTVKPYAPVSPRVEFGKIDRAHAAQVLRECDGNVRMAAKVLGIGRTTFYERYGKNLGDE